MISYTSYGLLDIYCHRILLKNTPSFKSLAGVQMWVLGLVKATLTTCFFISSLVPMESGEQSTRSTTVLLIPYHSCRISMLPVLLFMNYFLLSQFIFHLNLFLKLLYITSIQGKREMVFLPQRGGHMAPRGDGSFGVIGQKPLSSPSPLPRPRPRQEATCPQPRAGDLRAGRSGEPRRREGPGGAGGPGTPTARPADPSSRSASGTRPPLPPCGDSRLATRPWVSVRAGSSTSRRVRKPCFRKGVGFVAEERRHHSVCTPRRLHMHPKVQHRGRAGVTLGRGPRPGPSQATHGCCSSARRGRHSRSAVHRHGRCCASWPWRGAWAGQARSSTQRCPRGPRASGQVSYGEGLGAVPRGGCVLAKSQLQRPRLHALGLPCAEEGQCHPQEAAASHPADRPPLPTVPVQRALWGQTFL